MPDAASWQSKQQRRMMTKFDVKRMANDIITRTGFKGNTAIVLGSGLGDFAENFDNPTVVPYASVNGYPKPTVEGHAGEFVFGDLNGIPVMVAKGRFHYYEGYPLSVVTLPIHLFSELGIKYLIITNAAGSMKKEFPPGDLMLITRHMDCTFREKMADPKWIDRPPYYQPEVLQAVRNASEKSGVKIVEGGYCWTQGPAYETPDEIHYYLSIKGTAVGMSTVPEIETAGDTGIHVVGISCLTNYAAGITDQPLTHHEVMETADRVKSDFAELIKEIITQFGAWK